MFRTTIYALTLLVLCACGASPDELLAEARQRMDKGKWNEALPLVQNAIEKDPQNGEAHNMLGVIYTSQNDYAKAESSFSTAINADSTRYKYFYNRGNARHQQGNLPAALADYHKAIGLQDNVADLYLNRGSVYHLLNRYENALADFNKAAALNPADKNIYYNRGNTNYMLNRYVEAIADFTASIKADDKFAKAYYGLGLSEIMLNQKENGCRNMENAKRLGFAEAENGLDLYCHQH